MTDALIVPSQISNAMGTNIITWAGLDSDDSGLSLETIAFADKTVQVFGTFGSGGSVTLQGSNDPRAAPGHASYSSAVWFSLVDPQGNAITKTSAAGEAVLENPRFIRPLVTAGDGTTAITVILAAKRSV